MAKSPAERVRLYRVRKRIYARENALCTRCFKVKPREGRTVCVSCRSVISANIKRKRQRDRESVKLEQVMAMQERAGDTATGYYLYADAARFHQEALKRADLPLADKRRITEKVAQAFLLNGKVRDANVWFGRLLSLYRESPEEGGSGSTETLFHMRQHRALECRGAEMLEVIRDSVEVAQRSGEVRLIKLAQLRLVEVLQMQSRYDEASPILQSIEVSPQDTPEVQGYYFKGLGWALGRRGEVAKCFENFEAALHIAKESADAYLITGVWLEYGVMAEELGETLHAKGCYEEALFIAQQYRIPWLIALDRLYYIRLLMRMGQTAVAHSYLREAIATSMPIPFLKTHCAIVGIPLALMADDQKALANCAQTEAIKLAFQLGEPDIIGGVASAFAKLYAFRGHGQAARSLLHRSLEKISSAHGNLDVVLAVGRYGAMTDVPRALALLKARTSRAGSKQYKAGLSLFEAYVERRNGSHDKAQIAAGKAAELFEAMHWSGYAEEARGVVPGKSANVHNGLPNVVPFSHMPALTAREREVAALVLQGYTNREIASKLFIALHTVEKHMNAIMRRLGVRSRHQVADLLESSPDRP